jgi:hypothetical protein
MAKLGWDPWHKAITLREDVRTGELSLATFAADLYAVTMGQAKPIYQDPKEFFALTYPTYNLRELAKDVILRLAGKNERAVRQLALPYGGGKTHTLITLYHLVNDPAKLPNVPAVREFEETFGQKPPRALVAALSFDKLDVEKGMEVKGPAGEKRWLKYPWSVLAFQLAGAEGIKALHADGKDVERETPPAENLLTDLLRVPLKRGHAVLVLIDEVLMYAREKAGADRQWRDRLVDFFQYLTQAVTKVDRCALVASLLASDPRKHDEVGREIVQDLSNIFARQREETVQPVAKEDVAELLRRRFFTTASIKDRAAFRAHAVAALKGVTDLDEQTKKDGKAAEERYAASFPFHPDLTDVLYSKWTALEGFQRARGILRTFALALRDAEPWDESPLVGPNVFLSRPERTDLSEAARELATVAAHQDSEGPPQNWDQILDGELAKAREIQAENAALKSRELEQAVFATFLHSQPTGKQALTRELTLLVAPCRPDRIEWEKALKRWSETSWFLDEAAISERDKAPDGTPLLPKAWRLGFKPNLRQMHYDAMDRVLPELIETKLIDEIGKAKSLTTGASAAGARVHTLPSRPNDVEDDGEFHFAILGPKAASDSGKPSPEAKRFIDETTAADRPRVFRNAVVLAAPSRDGLDVARKRIREYLGWEEVRAMLKNEKIDPIREETLRMHTDAARKAVPEAIQQAYSVVVTVSDKNEVQAFKITVNGDPLFTKIKQDPRARIQDTAISAEALLPEGPYNLWREGETTQWVKNLVGAFAQFPHLPKMLSRTAIVDTLVRGAREGSFVLRLTRPDRSVKTFWRTSPDEFALKDPGLEVVLPEEAELTELDPSSLLPGNLPGLWKGTGIRVGEVYDYFRGGNVVKVDKGGYEEPVSIPRAAKGVIDTAIHAEVKGGRLWLTAGPASLLSEEIPPGVLGADAVLRQPPVPIEPAKLLPATLADAWKDDETTALSLATALSTLQGVVLPWVTVRTAIEGALRIRVLEVGLGSAYWPCDFSGAGAVRLKLRKEEAGPLPPPVVEQHRGRVAQAELRSDEIQNLADAIGEITKVAAGHDLKVHVEISLGGDKVPPDEVVLKIDELLHSVSEKLKLR